MLTKVISGGQTGVDQAGLQAARKCGLATGGWAPKGWLTLGGTAPWLRDFDLRECPTLGYKARTWRNVDSSDATLRLATVFTSPGEICTANAVRRYCRPHMDVDLRTPPAPKEVAAWIVKYNVRILNVAGNSEKTSPGIGKLATEYLIKVFNYIQLEVANGKDINQAGRHQR